jgi:hypothetical protein
MSDEAGTGVLAQIYICPTHGDVDGVYYEDIDTVSDQIYPMMLCPFCSCTVAQKKTEDGVPCMREVTEEELAVESMVADEEWE